MVEYEIQRAIEALKALIDGRVGLKNVHKQITFPVIIAALEQQQKTCGECKSKSETMVLTLEELQERIKPVYVPLDNNEGYWCLCQNGYITPPSCMSFDAKDRPNWIFYDKELKT